MKPQEQPNFALSARHFPLFCLTLLALATSAFAGETVVSMHKYTGDSCRITSGESSCRAKGAGPEGAYYRSNFSRNAVILTNDTADFMTFFVYFADSPGPNSVERMVNLGATVYEFLVPPYKTYLTNQRGSVYWVCAKPGEWGIDVMRNRIVRL
jgi:hypothetical protein